MVYMVRKLLAVLFGLLIFNVFFFTQGQVLAEGPRFYPFGTVWYLLMVIAAQAFLFLAFYRAKTSFRQTTAATASALAITLAFLSVFRASEVDRLLVGFASFGLTLIATYLYSLSHDRFGAITEMMLLPFTLFMSWMLAFVKVFEELPRNVLRLTGRLAKVESPISIEKKTSSAVVRGLLLAAPVFGVILLLLVSADPIFASRIGQLFNIHLPNISDAVARLLYTLAIAGFLTPIAWLVTDHVFHSPFHRDELKNLRIESIVVIGSIALLLASFLIIQFRYLFTTVSETELHQFGVQTYSEYVRKGFSELLLVSLIVYGVSGVGMVIHRLQSSVEGKLLRIVNIVLLSETIVFIISILRRVWLYQLSHGLSRIRIYGLLFLVLMILLTVTLILRHIRSVRRPWYLFEASSVVVIIFLALFINTDYLIAHTFKPTVNNEVDYTYIARLSPDAVDGWIEGYGWAKNVLSDPSLVTKTLYTENERRHVYYSRELLYTLRGHRDSYQRMYEHPAPEFHDLSKPAARYFNWAEYGAYQKAKTSIFGSELDQLIARAETVWTKMEMLNQDQSLQLDRSSRSPLVR